MAERYQFSAGYLICEAKMIEQPLSRIYLMRHANAASSAPGERDFDRPLDEKGYAEAERIADRAADLGYRPDRILSSTANRCRQTAEIARRAMRETLEIQFIDELYNGTQETYETVLAGQENVQSIMLIGHNPAIDQLLEGLIGAPARQKALPGGYPTAGLAVLDHAGGDNGPIWALRDFLKP